MVERQFTSMDVERVLTCGIIFDAPEHDVRHGNWKYKIRALTEGCLLEIVVVIDALEDYDEQPLILPVTGYWTGEGTLNGKRTDWDEAGDRGKGPKKVHE